MHRTTGIFLVLLTAVIVAFGWIVIRQRNRIAVKQTPSQLVVAEQDPVDGNPFAPVTLIEVGDFQCPYCLAMHPTMKVLRARYHDQIRFVWKDYPITSLHPEALPAAVAARCAQTQGRFWEMHDTLFENQSRLGGALYKEIAVSIGLDVDAFTACQSSKTARDIVDESFQSSEKSGVNAVPWYVINGVVLPGTLTAQELETTVQKSLE